MRMLFTTEFKAQIAGIQLQYFLPPVSNMMLKI